MTYRPPLRKRWKDPFILSLTASGIWLGIFLALHTPSRHLRLESSLILFGVVGFVTFARRSWLIWTTSVTADDTGLRWSRGSELQALRWDEISELGFSYTAGRRRLKIGPVRALSKMLHPLPLLPQALYGELKSRIGGLPPDIEDDYYRRTGGAPRS